MQVIKSVSVNGDEVTWVLRACNDSSIMCYNGKVAIDIPEGVSITGPSSQDSTIINVPVGVYDREDDIWYVGDLEAKKCTPVATFEFTVDNIELADPEEDRFLVVAEFTTSCDEDITADNTNTLVINVVDDCTNVNLSVSDSSPENSADLTVS